MDRIALRQAQRAHLEQLRRLRRTHRPTVATRRPRRWGTTHYLRRSRSLRQTESNAWILIVFVAVFCLYSLLIGWG